MDDIHHDDGSVTIYGSPQVGKTEIDLTGCKTHRHADRVRRTKWRGVYLWPDSIKGGPVDAPVGVRYNEDQCSASLPMRSCNSLSKSKRYSLED